MSDRPPAGRPAASDAGRAILALIAAVLIVFGGIMTFDGKVL